jgi:cysteine desulfurase
VFCSGGTEADNLAVFGSAANGGTVVCSAVEHPAVREPVMQLGGRVVGVDRQGFLDLEQLRSALDPSVSLVSVMLANNESGVIQPLHEIAEIMAEEAPNALLHTDAVQAFAWIDVATHAAPAHLISLAAHKFGGPKGVGALAIRAGSSVRAQLVGGGQERGVRSGTHNSPGIVGMGQAAKDLLSSREETNARVSELRDRLANGLLETIPGAHETAVLNPGSRGHKVPGSCHLCFENIESEALLFLLERDRILASAASSCASGAQHPSHVLEAMGYSPELAAGSLRLSLGYASTGTDVDHALAVIPPAVARLREMGS